jgi:hypothetical protein
MKEMEVKMGETERKCDYKKLACMFAKLCPLHSRELKNFLRQTNKFDNYFLPTALHRLSTAKGSTRPTWRNRSPRIVTSLGWNDIVNESGSGKSYSEGQTCLRGALKTRSSIDIVLLLIIRS